VIGFEGAPRYAQAIQALTGDTEIVPPGITLESDRWENMALMRTRLFVGTFAFAASPANFNQLAIGTPNQTILSCIRQVKSDVAANVAIVTSLAGFSAAVTIGNLDGRWSASAGSPATKFFTKQAAQIAPVSARWSLAANEVFLCPWVLRGSIFQLLIESAAANVGQAVSVWGYERVIRPEENLE
jgi:hypothetical protein